MEAMQTSLTPTEIRRPPGPSSWPLVGNVLDVRAAGDLVAYLEDQWRAHGDTFRFKLLGTRPIVLSHPEALKHVLSTRRERYAKGKIYDAARSILGTSVLTLEGDAWKTRRALAQPAFHRQALARLTTIMARTGARFLDDLAARVGDGSLEIDAHREMVKLTLDVVIAALLGDEGLRGADISYEALGASLQLMSESANGVVLPSWVPTPHNLKLRRTLRELDGIMYALIARMRERRTDDGSLLSMILSAVDADTGQPLSDKSVRDEVFTFFVAGHETMALTLTWMLHYLDGRPSILARMRGEVDGAMQGRDPAFEDVRRLPYVRQVVEETLRLRPPAPLVARNVVANDEIDGYRVRAGDVVFPFFWAAHRHPAFWSDAERFDPDRFAPERVKDRHSWAFVPFSGGPRTCIGNMFALFESSILVAQLLNRFDVEVLPCADVKPVAVITLRPSGPVRVVLRRRCPAQGSIGGAMRLPTM
jgi:cytochrome P450